jgi:hypothetical protein
VSSEHRVQFWYLPPWHSLYLLSTYFSVECVLGWGTMPKQVTVHLRKFTSAWEVRVCANIPASFRPPSSHPFSCLLASICLLPTTGYFYFFRLILLFIILEKYTPK